MPWSRITFYCALVAVYCILCNGKTKPRTLFSAANHWKENLFFNLLRYTRAIIDNFNLTNHFVALSGNGKAPINSGSKGKKMISIGLILALIIGISITIYLIFV